MGTGSLRYDFVMSPYAASSIDALLDAIRAELPALARLGVVRVGVFGSRARGESRPDSDVEILVQLEPKRDLLDLVAVRQYLESGLGLPVDVTTPSGLRDEDRDAILRELRYAA